MFSVNNLTNECLKQERRKRDVKFRKIISGETGGFSFLSSVIISQISLTVDRDIYDVRCQIVFCLTP